MKSLQTLLLSFGLILLTIGVPRRQEQHNTVSPVKSPAETRVYARCYGNTPCLACTTCSGCKHCNAGGTCGICAKPKKATGTEPARKPAPDTPASTGQCKGITKKGTRCSRAGKYGGYCFQHG